MTMTPFPEAEAIAAKMSEAQRRAIVLALGDGRIVATGDVAEWSVYATAPTITTLRKLGIGESGSRRNTYLTPLGLAVRQILKGSK